MQDLSYLKKSWLLYELKSKAGTNNKIQVIQKFELSKSE